MPESLPDSSVLLLIGAGCLIVLGFGFLLLVGLTWAAGRQRPTAPPPDWHPTDPRWDRYLDDLAKEKQTR